MAHAKDMLGKTFERLTVVERMDKDAKRTYRWRCVCTCGNTIIVPGSSLRRGGVKSCGCLRREAIATRNTSRRLPPGEAFLNHLYSVYKGEASIRSLEFLLSIDEFSLLIRQDCSYCGSPPTQRYVPKRMNESFPANGIDRLNNNIGYTSSNCVSCCRLCNKAKGTLSKDDFLNLVKNICLHNNLI